MSCRELNVGYALLFNRNSTLNACWDGVGLPTNSSHTISCSPTVNSVVPLTNTGQSPMVLFANSVDVTVAWFTVHNK